MGFFHNALHQFPNNSLNGRKFRSPIESGGTFDVEHSVNLDVIDYPVLRDFLLWVVLFVWVGICH